MKAGCPIRPKKTVLNCRQSKDFNAPSQPNNKILYSEILAGLPEEVQSAARCSSLAMHAWFNACIIIVAHLERVLETQPS